MTLLLAMWAAIDILKNFDENRHFWKILTNIEIFQIFPKFEIYGKVQPKSRFLEKFDQNWDFSIFFFYQNRDFSKILTIVEIFRKL